MSEGGWDIERYIDVPGGRVWSGEAGAGPGTPLLLLHGGPGLPSDYLSPLARLADERRVIVYDQLGCGRSERPAHPGLWRIERFVDELRAVRSALELPQLAIFGHSWGSMLAVDYALTKAAGIAGIILASPAISIPRWLEDAAKYRSELPAAVQATLARHEAAGEFTAPEYDEATRYYYERHVCRKLPWPDALERANAGFGAASYRTMWGANEFTITGNLARYNRSGRLKEIAVPVLFTCGRYDEATPDATSWYAALLPGSEVRVFENSAHMPHLEEEDAYLEALRVFLRSID